MMPNPTLSRVDRRTLGGRLVGTWQWTDVELKAGVDAQRSEHRKVMNPAGAANQMVTAAGSDVLPWVPDAMLHSYGVFGELTLMPVTLRVPNTYSLPVGTRVPFGKVDHNTLEWSDLRELYTGPGQPPDAYLGTVISSTRAVATIIHAVSPLSSLAVASCATAC